MTVSMNCQPCFDTCNECIPCNDHIECNVQLQPCCDQEIDCCDDACEDACNEPDCIDWHPLEHYCCDIDHTAGCGIMAQHTLDALCGDAGMSNIQLTPHCTECSSSGIETPSSTSMDPMPTGEPFHCHWQQCDLSFLNSLDFDQHFLMQHLQPMKASSTDASPNSLSCAWDQCVVAPQSVPALFDHVKHDHVEVEQHHRCKWLVADQTGNITTCGVCLNSAADFTKHITEEHVGSRQKEYVCYWEDCDRCHRPFTQRQKITRHIVVHTGDRPYKCLYCDYACSEEAVLKQHQRTHTGEKPFHCSVCHKSFSASTALSVHMRTHTGFKPLTCKFPGCGKRFSESSNLAKHERTHSQIKQFKCSQCAKSFQRPDQLKRHLNSVHKDNDLRLDAR